MTADGVHHRDKLIRRLQSLQETWTKHDWPLDALVLVCGKSHGDSEIGKVSAMHIWLLGVEFTDSAVGLTRSGKLVFMTSKKKLLKLDHLEGEDTGLELLEREGPLAAKRFLKAIRGDLLHDLNVGMLLEQPTNGPWAPGFQEELQSLEGLRISECKDRVSVLLGPKDDEELTFVRQSARLAAMIEVEFVEKVTQILDVETEDSNAQVVSMMKGYVDSDEVLEQWEDKLRDDMFTSEDFEMPICSFQSGSTFNLDAKAVSRDEQVAMKGTYLMSVGVLYHEYASFIARTLIVEPTPFQKAVYRLTMEVQELVIKELQPSVRLADVYKSAANHVRSHSSEIHADLRNKFVSNVGFLMGLEFSDPEVIIHADCQRVVQSGMVFAVSVGFHESALPQPWAIWVADTVIVTGDGLANQVLTASCSSAPTEIMFDTETDENLGKPPEDAAMNDQTPDKALPTEAEHRDCLASADEAESSKIVETSVAALSTGQTPPEAAPASSSHALVGQVASPAQPDKEAADEANVPAKSRGPAKKETASREAAASETAAKEAVAKEAAAKEVAAKEAAAKQAAAKEAAAKEAAAKEAAAKEAAAKEALAKEAAAKEAAAREAEVSGSSSDSSAASLGHIASKEPASPETSTGSQACKPLEGISAPGAAAIVSTAKRGQSRKASESSTALGLQVAEPGDTDSVLKKPRVSTKHADEVAKKPAANLEASMARSRKSLAKQAQKQREYSDELVVYASGDSQSRFSELRQHVRRLVCPAHLRKKKNAEIRRRFSEEAAAAPLCDDLASPGSLGSHASPAVASGSMPAVSVQLDARARRLKIPGIKKMEDIELKDIKRIETDRRGKCYLLRVFFNCMSTEGEAAIFPNMIEFVSNTGEHFESIHQQYKDLQKTALQRGAGECAARPSKAANLKKSSDARSFELLQVGVLSQNTSLPVKLEAHGNGFCWIVQGSASSFAGKEFSVLYSSIDFGCYGDGLFYLHFKEAVDICGKPFQEVLFRLPGAANQGKLKEFGVKASAQDSTLEAFRHFCTDAASLSVIDSGRRLQRLMLEQQIICNLPSEGPGPLRRGGLFLCPQALVSLESRQPLCVLAADMDIVIIERNEFRVKPEIDMVIIRPDYSKRPTRISAIAEDEFQGIASWLIKHQIVWYTFPGTEKWNTWLQRIIRDPSNFFDNGGWDVIVDIYKQEGPEIRDAPQAILDGLVEVEHLENKEAEVNSDESDEEDEEEEDEEEEEAEEEDENEDEDVDEDIDGVGFAEEEDEEDEEEEEEEEDAESSNDPATKRARHSK